MANFPVYLGPSWFPPSASASTSSCRRSMVTFRWEQTLPDKGAPTALVADSDPFLDSDRGDGDHSGDARKGGGVRAASRSEKSASDASEAAPPHQDVKVLWSEGNDGTPATPETTTYTGKLTRAGAGDCVLIFDNTREVGPWPFCAPLPNPVEELNPF